jgi:Cd2+/Zn2+-exporting ATPase
MDKTGTLTHGSFEVTEVFPKDKKEEILTLAALAESGSLHPVARSVLRAAPKVDASSFTVTEIAGKGVTACDGNTKIDVGSLKFLKESGVEVSGIENNKSAVYLAKNGIFVGYIVIEDAVKGNAEDVISALKKGGVKTVMLTGDNPACAKAVAEAVGVDEWHAGMLPQDKVAHVEQLIAEKPKGKTLCFIGDGINDAPVLSVADVGLSMGGIGSDAAIEASDVVIVNDDLSSVLRARRIAVKTMRIV